jgi:hypothetical protein
VSPLQKSNNPTVSSQFRIVHHSFLLEESTPVFSGSFARHVFFPLLQRRCVICANAPATSGFSNHSVYAKRGKGTGRKGNKAAIGNKALGREMVRVRTVRVLLLVVLTCCVISSGWGSVAGYIYMAPPYPSYWGGSAFAGTYYAGVDNGGFLYTYVSAGPAYGWAIADAVVWNQFTYNEPGGYAFVKLRVTLSFYARANTAGDFARVTIGVQVWWFTRGIWVPTHSATVYEKSVVAGSVTVKEDRTIIHQVPLVEYGQIYKIHVIYHADCVSGWFGGARVQFSSTSTSPSWCYLRSIELYSAV